MAASMRNFRLIFRVLKKRNIQPNHTFSCSIPCYDMKYMNTVEKLPPEETFPEYEISTKEFIYVEKLLPKETVPAPPSHISYPTPSGWVPPNKEKTKDLPYSVERNKNHNLPVYIKHAAERGLKITTVIRNVHGDIWQFEQDVREHIEDTLELDHPLLTEVSEITRKVTLKGNRIDLVGKWLLNKGF